MNGMLRWTRTVGSTFILSVGVAAAQNPGPVVVTPSNPISQPTLTSSEREEQTLLSKMNDLSTLIAKEIQNPQVWRYQITQAEVMFQLAARAKGKEREDWLKMAVESHYSAAVQAPENQPAAYQRLMQLPAQLAQAFPGSTAISYAAMQGIQADYIRVLNKSGDNPNYAKLYLRDRLVRFAQEYPLAKETPPLILEAALLSEKVGRSEDAIKCYRYLTVKYPKDPIARKAAGTLWRMSSVGKSIDLELPLVYPRNANGITKFDLKSLAGRFVVLYFWSPKNTASDSGFDSLRALLSQHSTGLEVVYVCLDDKEKAQDYLSGRLTIGTHVYQGSGSESQLATEFGIQSLPEMMLLDKEGKLIQHSLDMAKLEVEVEKHLPQKHVTNRESRTLRKRN